MILCDIFRCLWFANIGLRSDHDCKKDVAIQTTDMMPHYFLQHIASVTEGKKCEKPNQKQAAAFCSNYKAIKVIGFVKVI